jgi:glycosyltransferase involved in cell wall biosynthesis
MIETVRVHEKPEPRNVMFLLSSLCVGGSERKAVRLANALATGTRQVGLAYLSPPESLLSQLHPAIAALNLHRRGKFSFRALRRLATIVRERNVNMLVALNLYSGLYAVLTRLLCKQLRLRVAVSVNTTDFATRKEALQMLIYRQVLRRADTLVFGAERQRRLWCSRYGLDGRPDKSIVLYNGVDTSEFSKGSVVPATLREPPGRVMLGTVGAFRIGKAQIDLVRAVHQLVVRGADVGAILVGDGSQRPQIEREIQRLEVNGRVRLVGEARDVRPYLAAMDVFVLPSVAVETFSNAVLEAMSMSCPVVVAQVGGMDEMLQFGGGMMYPPGDVRSLCDALMPLIEDAGERTRLGAEARQVAEKHFSFGRMLSDFGERVLDAG